MNILRTIKDNLYLIVPFACIAFYALIILLRFDFVPYQGDFETFYNAGNQIINDPSRLYDVPAFLYMPAFACVFTIFTPFEFITAYYIYYALNYVFAILMILEFNKILKLMNLDKKFYRFLFLLIIANGWLVYYQFYQNQTKFMVTLILLFIIRRELQFRRDSRKKDFKYYLINYSLFIFALSMVPHLIFLLLIYLFYEVEIKDIFKKENVQNYLLIIIIFILQNILLFIYPNLISGFLFQGLNFEIWAPQQNTFYQFYLREFLYADEFLLQIDKITSTIIIGVFTVYLILNREYKIEIKFSLFSLGFLFLNAFNSLNTVIILLPFCCLLFMKYIQPEENLKNFIKQNLILIIGLGSIVLISFMPRSRSIFNYLPLLNQIPWLFFVNLRWILLLGIMVISLIILYIKWKTNFLKNAQITEKN